MLTATFQANPIPYSKACDTFRPRIGQSAAIRAGLGCIALVHFFKPCAMLNSLVRKLTSEGRPSSIKNRLRHGGLGESGGVHIAYRNVIKLTHDAGAELVVKVVSSIRNLSVYRRNTFLFVGALCNSQSIFGTPVNAPRFNFFTRGQCCEVFQSKVNSNATDGLTNACSNGININHDIQKPVPLAVSGKIGAILNLSSRQVTTVEHAKGFSGKTKGITLSRQISTLERHPSQRFLAAIAQIWALLLSARLGVLFAKGVDRSRVQSKLFTTACGELIKVKPCMPSPAKTHCIFLPIITEVPDKVYCSALLVQQSVQRFHPVSVNQNHFCFFKKSSTARRISSATERPVFTDRTWSFSTEGSVR